jgi:hypothetical protein
VPLHLDPWGTVFVVFRKPAKTPSRTLPKVTDSSIATVEGAWDLSFQPDRGTPAKITLDKLASWSDSSDEGVKYFSGTARTPRRFKLAQSGSPRDLAGRSTSAR